MTRRWLILEVSVLWLGCAPVETDAPRANAAQRADAGGSRAGAVTESPEASTLAPVAERVLPEPTLAMDPALQVEPPASAASQALRADDADDADADEAPVTEDADEAPAPEPQEPIDFEPGGRSLRVRRSITVRAAPREDAAPIGTLAQDVRVSWVRAVKGAGCDAWVEIEPRGWICERYLEGNFRAPRARELPLLPDGTLTPGVYARIVGKTARAYPSLASARRRRRGHRLRGALTVRLQGEVRVRHRRFWRTSDGEYIEARFLRRYRPSEFVGLDAAQLDRLTLPIAWAQSRAHPGQPVAVHRGASLDSPKVGEPLPLRTVVSLQQRSVDGRWAQIGEDRWVSLDDLHVARAEPPPDGAGPQDRWLDVDLQEQTLVAYQGTTPVYATLISSGRVGHETPEGLFRIWIKFAEVDMKGEEPDGRPYKVATVPWVMFFQGDFALHTSYWHDHFGRAVSHGCINLSPRDARALYGWSSPQVPDGWSMVYANPTTPGSLLRIHRGALSDEAAPGPLVCSVEGALAAGE